jgi:hypothetical protein
MSRPNVYKYTYAFLYQSMAVYATTLALYLVIRAMIANGELLEVFYDPVVYLLCLIILLSALAVIYNLFMRRRIEVTPAKLILESAVRKNEIPKQDVKAVRIRMETSRGFMSRSQVITIFLKSRRRPLRILPYNFERNEELFAAIKSWAGEMVHNRPKRKPSR